MLMKRTTSFAAVLILLSATACSKDRSESAPVAPAAESTDPSGVGVVSANELGAKNRRYVTVSTTSKQARTVFERARELHENVRPLEARKKFERAIELDPEFALAHAYLGFLADDQAKADEYFDRAVELAEKLPADERLVIEALIARKGGNNAAEIESYKELSKLVPKDWRTAMWAAEAANRSGDVKRAIELFLQAVELNPEAAEPHNMLAYMYAYTDDIDKGVEHAKRYAELKPSEPNPQDSLGEILMMAGRFDEAQIAFEKAVEMSPKFTVALEGLAMTHVYRGQWDQAVVALERAAKIAPPRQRFNVERQLAYTYLAAGKSKKAFAQIDSMAKLIEDNDLAAWKVRLDQTRADIELGAGNAAAARKVLERAIGAVESDKQRVGAHVDLLVARLWSEVQSDRAKLAKKSLAELEQLIGDSEGDTYGSLLEFARGSVAFATGDYDAAIETLGPIVDAQIRPDDPYALPARWQYARALEKSGNVERAKRVRASAERWIMRDAAHAFERTRLFGTGS
jgi:tetratricopeptide (TPR) repeat protein